MTPHAAARPLPSIRTRLARSLLGWALLWGAAIASSVWLAADHEVQELLDETLRAAAQALAPTLAAGIDAGLSAPVQAPAHDEEHFAWQLVGADAHVLQRSALAPAQALHATPHAGHSDVAGWRVYGQALGREGRMLYVAQTRDERNEARNGVALATVLGALAVGAVGHFWLRLRVRDELRPLERLGERLAQHDPLAGSLGPAERDELRSVQRAVDDLGRRLAQRIAHERAFSAHAAHALRTPLAGIDAQLAVALRESPPALVPRLQRVRAASARLQRVVAALLALFRSDAELQRVPVALDTLVERLPVDGVQVSVGHGEGGDGGTIVADPDLLAAALANLIDNAARHGARHVVVEVAGAGTLRVRDDGPGMDQDRRAALQTAIDAQQYDGATGLGLQLADLVARAHGGRLRLAASGAGFSVELDLGGAAG